MLKRRTIRIAEARISLSGTSSGPLRSIRMSPRLSPGGSRPLSRSCQSTIRLRWSSRFRLVQFGFSVCPFHLSVRQPRSRWWRSDSNAEPSPWASGTFFEKKIRVFGVLTPCNQQILNDPCYQNLTLVIHFWPSFYTIKNIFGVKLKIWPQVGKHNYEKPDHSSRLWSLFFADAQERRRNHHKTNFPFILSSTFFSGVQSEMKCHY